MTVEERQRRWRGDSKPPSTEELSKLSWEKDRDQHRACCAVYKEQSSWQVPVHPGWFSRKNSYCRRQKQQVRTKKIVYLLRYLLYKYGDQSLTLEKEGGGYGDIQNRGDGDKRVPEACWPVQHVL